jgi:hypothetical protein
MIVIMNEWGDSEIWFATSIYGCGTGAACVFSAYCACVSRDLRHLLRSSFWEEGKNQIILSCMEVIG